MTDEMMTRWRAERRSEHDIHVAQEQTQIEMLAELRHIRRALEALNEGSALFGTATGAGGVSSIQIEDNPTKERIVRISTKHYVGNPLTKEFLDAEFDAHAYAHIEAERRAMDAWRETVDALS